MKFLLTGVAGFVGSNLLEALLKLGHSVVGLDNFSTGHQKNLAEVQNNVASDQWGRFQLIRGDIRDAKDCNLGCKGVDIIFHNAALGSVPRSIEDPLRSNSNNVDGFLNIINVARETGVKRIVYASSSSAYGDHPGLPKIENLTGRPLSPYALTKVVNELYADVFSKVYGMQFIGLRYFNVFGPRQDPKGPYSAVIPKWIDALINHNPVYINGDGETTRDFCYVENVIQANLLAATTMNPSAINQVYNVAVGQNTTLNELFYEIRSKLSSRYLRLDNLEPTYLDFRHGDVRHSLADISKATRLLGYQPEYTWREGLSETIEWYITNSENLNSP